MRLLILSLVLWMTAQAAAAQRWTIEDYGFSVDIPKKFAMCGGGVADHGVGFYLDDNPASLDDGCAVKPTRRVITVFAGLGMDSTLQATAARVCGYGDKRGVTVQAPSGLALGDRPSISCRHDNRSEWIELLVVTECGVPSQKPHVPEMICSAWLHTTPDSFVGDLAIYRETIASVRFFEPRGYK
jgi:hypothetical protein